LGRDRHGHEAAVGRKLENSCPSRDTPPHAACAACAGRGHERHYSAVLTTALYYGPLR